MLKADEELLFFPTYGYQQANGEWRLPVHGWVFRQVGDSLRRRALLGSLRRLLRFSSGTAETGILNRRLRSFLVDNQAGRAIAVRMGDARSVLTRSHVNGHCHGDLKSANAITTPTTLAYTAVLPEGDTRKISGQIHVPGAEGVSVVSDIDDTIKLSEVNDRGALLRNTFLKPFTAVPGMAAKYAGWALQGAMFHYVSASPWLIYQELSKFTANAGFPAGSWHLKLVRFKDATLLNLFKAPLKYKVDVIQPILQAFPRRHFVLIGDTSAQDPEVYGALATKFSDQIQAIYIRDMSGLAVTETRCRVAFANVRCPWQIFHEAAELPSQLA